MDNTSLNHHGILGMKWGVRRFQRRDGTLTPAGKKRRGDKEERKEETLEERRSRILKSSNPSEIYKNKDILTTQEIKERLDRIDTERRLASVAEETKKTGLERVNTILEYGRKIDEGYSFISNSSIGKSIAKKLGLEIPNKEFNLEKVWNNKNKLSSKDLKDATDRLRYENIIENELKKRRAKEDSVKAEKKAKKDSEKAKKETQEKINKLNKEINKAKKESEKEQYKENNNKKTSNEKTSNEKTSNEKNETYTGEVFGEGKSSFNKNKWYGDTFSNKSEWKEGRDYFNAEFEDVTINNSTSLVPIGQKYLEDKYGV